MRALAFVVLAATGCGGAGPAPAKTDPVPAAPAPTATGDAPIAKPVELPAVVRALPDEAALYVYADGDRLSASPLVAVYTASVEEAGADPLADARQACGFDPVEAVKEGALAARVTPGSEPAIVAVLAIDRGPVVALECLKKLGGKPNATGGLDLGNDLVALQAGDHVVIGEPSAAAIARARVGREGGGPERLRAALERHPDAALVAVGNLGERVRESGFGWTTLTVTSTPKRFAARVEADTPDATTARAYAAAFDPARSGHAVRDMPLIRTWAEDSRVIGELAVDGGPTEQAFRLGVAAALAVNAVKKYVASAKTAEAKHHVGALARELRAYAERRPTGKSFPKSAPPTPAKPPAGTKVALGPDAWKHPTWKALGFAPTEPLYYSYRIVTTTAGQRAEVRAEGDLDGDGVLSRFSVRLRIEKNAVEVEPLEIADELE